MKTNSGFDDIVSTTTVELPKIDNRIHERKAEIDERLKAIQEATDKAATGKNLETIDRIHSLLFSTKSGRISKLDDKFKYALWAFGFIVGLVIGWIVAGVFSYMTRNVDALNSVDTAITVLIIVIFGGLGWFATHWYTDRRS